jgi:predicted NBD/HSP70 family sugar kinase
MAVIGLDLGGTKLAGAIFQPDGNTINKIVLPLEKRGGNEVGDLIDQLIAEEISFAVSIPSDAASRELLIQEPAGCGLQISPAGRITPFSTGSAQEFMMKGSV